MKNQKTATGSIKALDWDRAYYTPLGIKISSGKTPQEIVRQKFGGVTGVEPP
jgi:hypothetical protein